MKLSRELVMMNSLTSLPVSDLKLLCNRVGICTSLPLNQILMELETKLTNRHAKMLEDLPVDVVSRELFPQLSRESLMSMRGVSSKFLPYADRLLKKNLMQDFAVEDSEIPDYEQMSPKELYLRIAELRLPKLADWLTTYYWEDFGLDIEDELSVEKLKTMLELNLSYGGIDELPVEIGLLPKLESLNLDGNNLATLPKSLRYLQNLATLRVKNNQLTEIPAQLGELKNLQYLNLNNNQLTEIPAQLGELKNLQYLNLNNNQLTEIPKSITLLPRLTRVGLKKNRFAKEPDFDDPRILDI
jgi:Leucine-rich repeat (LRR) protein